MPKPIVPQIPLGLCGCGCGNKTWVASYTKSSRGWVKGEPVRFCKGHCGRGYRIAEGRVHQYVNDSGYVLLYMPEHQNAKPNGFIREHVLMAAKALGKPLPVTAIVHHINERPADNWNSNLVICENNAYHQLLHRRKRAYEACGKPDFRKCYMCQEYDNPETMMGYGRLASGERTGYFHYECRRKVRKGRN